MNDKFQLRQTFVAGRQNYLFGSYSCCRHMLRTWGMGANHPAIHIAKNAGPEFLMGAGENCAIWLLPGYNVLENANLMKGWITQAVHRGAIVCTTEEFLAEIALENFHRGLRVVVGPEDESLAQGFRQVRDKVVVALREPEK